MKSIIIKMLSHQLIRGSLIIVLGSTIVNIGNYVFHLLTGRLLGPTQYGVLESIISSLYILGIIPLALGITVVKFVSQFPGSENKEEARVFFRWLNVKLLVLGSVISLVLLFLVPIWSSFLKLTDNLPLIFAILTFPFLLLATSARSFLQGILNFFGYSVSVIFEVVVKIILAVIFIFLGWSVSGAVGAMLLGLVVAYLITLYLLREINSPKKVKSEFKQGKKFLKYSLPVTISILSITSLYTVDIILVKHFFNAFDAGIYAAVSILGKIIYFAPASLVSVMFPLVSSRQARGEKYHGVFWLTFVLVAACSALLSSIYFFFPKLMINILFGVKYLSGASILYWFAIFISLYALCNTLLNFYLSLGKTRASLLVFVGAFLQIILIFVWHADLLAVVIDSIIASSILLASLLLYYPYAAKKKLKPSLLKS